MAELGHLNREVGKLEDMVHLLVAGARLARWQESQRVKNLRRKMGLERELEERDYVKKVVVEKAAGKKKKRLARRDLQAKKAEEVQKSQAEAARLCEEQHAAAKAALTESVEECVKATTPEELVPRAVKVAEAAAHVERLEAGLSPAGEDVDVGDGWRVVGARMVRKVEVVSRLGGPGGRAWNAGLSAVVGKMQTLCSKWVCGMGDIRQDVEPVCERRDPVDGFGSGCGSCGRRSCGPDKGMC